jgi:hypothetical protein
MHRLEQVRLAGAVRAGDEDEAGLERNVEPFVGAKVPQRHLGHDQAVPLGSIEGRREKCVA